MQAITTASGMAGHLSTSCPVTATTETSRTICPDVSRICYIRQDNTTPTVCLSAHRRPTRSSRTLWFTALKFLRNLLSSTGLQVTLVPNAGSRHLLNHRGVRVRVFTSPRDRYLLICRWFQLEISMSRSYRYLLICRDLQARASTILGRRCPLTCSICLYLQGDGVGQDWTRRRAKSRRLSRREPKRVDSQNS
jgi:hypothetical protein